MRGGGLIGRGRLVALALGLLAAAGPARSDVPPSNDNFADATPITSLPFTDFTLSDLATPEVGQPVCAGTHSIWYRFDPAVDTNVVLDTTGSTIRYYRLGIFEGTSLSSLTQIACERGDYSTAIAGFPARAGHSYRIAVGSDNLIDYGARVQLNADIGAEFTGRVTSVGGTPLEGACVTAREAPPNYRYVSTRTASDGTYRVAGLRATTHTLSFGCVRMYYDEYYSDTEFPGTPVAVTRGEVKVIDASLRRLGSVSGRVTGAGGEPLAGICTTAYDPATGYTVNSFDPGSGDDGAYTAGIRGTYKVLLRFRDCVNPVQYRPVWWPSALDRSDASPIEVTDGLDTAGIDVSLPLAVRPANDDRSAATEITALPFAESTNTYLATREQDEPVVVPSSCGSGPTVWYRYTAPSAMWVTATTEGSDYNAAVAIFRASATGAAPMGLVAESCRLTPYGGANVSDVALQAGETYLFQVIGSGELRFAVRQEVAPPNDARASALDIGALPFNEAVRTFAATAEAGEDVRCGSMTRTVWYRLNPVTNGRITVRTTGEAARSGAIAVYRTVAAAAPPVRVACSNEEVALYPSSTRTVAFDALASNDYWIQVGGSSGSGGAFVVQVTGLPAPANDDRASATPVTSLPFVDEVELGYATLEDAEPAACGPSSRTVWYRFTAGSDGLVSVSTAGSQTVETALAVYREMAGGATLVQCDNDSDQQRKRLARAVLEVKEGESYLFQVGAIDTAGGRLHLEVRSEAPPANDTLSAATPITTTAEARTYAAGVEPDEVMACGVGSAGPPGKTVWYRFEAPAAGRYYVSTAGSDFDTTAGVYEPLGVPLSSPAGLRQIACNDDNPTTRQSFVEFEATAGKTYFIQIGGWRFDAGVAQIAVSPKA